MAAKPTLRTHYFDGDDLELEPVAAGEVLIPGQAWNDLHEIVHVFLASSAGYAAPPGLVDFVHDMERQTWPRKPLLAARAAEVNGHLAAARACLDDPATYHAITHRTPRKRVAEAEKVKAAVDKFEGDERATAKLKPRRGQGILDDDIPF